MRKAAKAAARGRQNAGVLAAGAKDGPRTILLNAEDVAGNITNPATPISLQIFVDTQGPQVTNVFITNVPAFNIFRGDHGEQRSIDPQRR